MEENSPEDILRRYISWKGCVAAARSSDMYSNIWYTLEVRNLTHERLEGHVNMHLIRKYHPPVEIELKATNEWYASNMSELGRVLLEDFSGKQFEEAVLEMEAAGG